MNGIETRAAYIRRRLMTLYNEHLADKMIPTSNRFLLYELIQLGACPSSGGIFGTNLIPFGA
jgi:hypothetical protein